MFKSKHSGWTWDLKRTPFGGGGFNPGNFLASIDPVEAFKTAANGAADSEMSATDWMTTNGWMIPLAMITAGVASGALGAGALAADGSIAAGSAELAGPSLAGSQAFDAAIASGASTAEASAAADAAAQAAIGTGQGIGTATGASSGVADIGLGTNAALQGPTYGELGVTGVPEGGMGPTYAEMGNTGLNTEQAINAADTASQLQQAKDALSTANDVKNAAKLAQALTSKTGSQLTNAAQNLATGQTGVASAIPALLRGNQNPFLQTAQQPIQNKKTDLASLIELLKQG